MAETDWPMRDLPGGLRLFPRDWPAAARAVALAIAGVTGLIVVLDAVVFRTHLPESYVTHYTSPLWPRMLLACAASAREEVFFRLVLTTLLVSLPLLVKRRPGIAWIVGAILVAQFVNVGGLVLIWPEYAIPRFWLVGAVWGWLYLRHGFVAALAGHGLCHLLLDPALSLALLATG